jgi:RHS repeat-associated protein
LVASITRPHNLTTEYTYESNRNLIDYVENKYNTTTISRYDYTNDAIGRRTAMEKSGTAFSATDTINYSYNDRSELTGADAVTDTNYNFGFSYDAIGNRATYSTDETGSTVTSSYTSNNLNQYTAVTNPTLAPTYDDDGDMLTNGNWTYTWNAENRMVSAVNGTTTIEFKYDYKGRRVEKKVTEDSTVTKQIRFVYDDYEQIEELDALNSNAVLKKRIWGDGEIICDIHGSTAYYALGDANKNITEYLDSSGTIQAHYEYSPFGKITVANGSMADDFDYRFSSEIFDSETSLVYYNFRYYSPDLGRWTKRDPIAEKGGYNLYGMVGNNSVNNWDNLGLWYPGKTTSAIYYEGIRRCRKKADKKTRCGENGENYFRRCVERTQQWLDAQDKSDNTSGEEIREEFVYDLGDTSAAVSDRFTFKISKEIRKSLGYHNIYNKKLYDQAEWGGLVAVTAATGAWARGAASLSALGTLGYGMLGYTSARIGGANSKDALSGAAGMYAGIIAGVQTTSIGGENLTNTELGVANLFANALGQCSSENKWDYYQSLVAFGAGWAGGLLSNNTMGATKAEAPGVIDEVAGALYTSALELIYSMITKEPGPMKNAEEK